MKRLVLIAGVIGFMAMPFSSAYAVGLKENSILSDNTIKLGDIFYDLSRDEDRVLGSAPRPGQEMVLNAKTLLRIALALDLPWRPNSNADHIVLRRDATIIPYEDIESGIQEALSNQGVFGNYELNIPNQYKQIVLPPSEHATFEITRLDVNTRKQSFEAMIAAPSADNPIQHFSISGYIEPVIEVPVLVENIENGRTIRANDITLMKIKETDFTRDTIADIQSLIGMTARRVLIAGRPVREVEVIAPQIIERGELVTLSLNTGIMNITTQVKSLENGAKGDVIRVLNTASNQTLQAIITGESSVEIAQN